MRPCETAYNCQVRLRLAAFCMALVIAGSSALGCGTTSSPDEASPSRQSPHRFARLQQRAVEVARGPETFRLELPPARLYFHYVGDDAGPATDAARLCVVFNGGPGMGSQLLLSQLGNRLLDSCELLYVDARNSGFSYSLDYNTELASSAHGNPYTDAADVLLLLSQHLVQHPAKRVTLIGESYGALRAALMVELMQRAAHEIANPSYRDPVLLQELSRREINIDSIVWLQPYVAGHLQDEAAGELLHEAGSIIYETAKDLGEVYEGCARPCDALLFAQEQLRQWGRSIYDVRAPDRLLSRWFEQATELAADVATTGEASEVLEFQPEQRVTAWRFLSAPQADDEPAWASLGTLESRDRFYLAHNTEQFDEFGYPSVGDSFAFDAAQWVDSALVAATSVSVFISDARYDAVVVTPSLARVFAEHPKVDSLSINSGDWALHAADGRVHELSVRRYDAGHSVAATDAAPLAADLRQWLGQL